mgnify:CR=1 FL=1
MNTTEVRDIPYTEKNTVSCLEKSACLRFPGDNIPVTVDGTQVCTLSFGSFVSAGYPKPFVVVTRTARAVLSISLVCSGTASRTFLTP